MKYNSFFIFGKTESVANFLWKICDAALNS